MTSLITRATLDGTAIQMAQALSTANAYLARIDTIMDGIDALVIEALGPVGTNLDNHVNSYYNDNPDSADSSLKASHGGLRVVSGPYRDAARAIVGRRVLKITVGSATAYVPVSASPNGQR